MWFDVLIIGLVVVLGAVCAICLLEMRKLQAQLTEKPKEKGEDFTADALVSAHYERMFSDLNERIKEVIKYGGDCLGVGMAPGPSRDLLIQKMKERGFSVSLRPTEEWGRTGCRYCHGVVGGLKEFVQIRW